MIQRFVFVKLLEAHVAGRASLAQRLRARFEEAGAAALVGLPADESAAKWDLSIVVTAGSLEAWHALAQFAAIASIFAEVSAQAKIEKQWTFEVGGALATPGPRADNQG